MIPQRDNPREPGEDERVARLCRALRSGDEASFETFYRAWYPRVFAIVCEIFRTRESIAHDAVQETFVKVIRNLPILHSPAALEAWMVRAARSSAIDLLRRELRRRTREASLNRHTVAQEATSDEQRTWLREALLQLDPQEVDLLRARYVLDQPLRAGVDAGKSTPAAAQGRFTRALHRLRRWAEDSWT